METQNQTVAVQPSLGLGAKLNNLLETKPIILQLLKFAAIGALNTALDFLILNMLSKTLGISSGFKLGQVNIAGFVLAVIQSYFWNKYWTFGQLQGVSLLKNFWRLVGVGALGAVALFLVLLGSKNSAHGSFYGILLGAYLIGELILWDIYGFSFSSQAQNAQQQFWTFIAVSVGGLLINSLLLWLITSQISLVSNPDLNKNIAKIMATGASLVWNFIGYKLFVFKK